MYIPSFATLHIPQWTQTHMYMYMSLALYLYIGFHCTLALRFVTISM